MSRRESRNRREEAERIVEELNNLYPHVREHTNLPEYGRVVLKRVTCGVVFLCSALAFFAWLGFVIVSGLNELADISKAIAACVFVVSVVGLVWSCSRLAKNDKHGICEWSWSRSSVETLQERLNEVRRALEAYDEAKQATQKIAEKTLKLGAVIEKMSGTRVEVDCQKRPFKIKGSLFGCEFSFDLSNNGYDQLLMMAIGYYYGHDQCCVQEFKKGFGLEEDE